MLAPPLVSPGEEFYIEIVLHDPAQFADIAARVRENQVSSPVAVVSPSVPLNVGDEVRITMDGDGAKIRDPVQVCPWQGCLAHLLFATELPEEWGARRFTPIVRLFINGAPAAVLVLRISSRPDAPFKAPQPITHDARRTKKVFISYAEEDRPTVLQYVQVLSAVEIENFMDILTLSPGQRWELELYKEIADCDKFLLFWSSNAKGSEWVVREARVALENRKASRDDRPDIVPVIEGPPPVPPPEELKEIHFNDKLRYIIFAVESANRLMPDKANRSLVFSS
jgi:hypothetical protein